MQLQWNNKNIFTCAPYLSPKGIFTSAKYWRMGGGSAYLREPAPQEEGGPFETDFTKVYTTESLTTSSQITPENKCDIFASLQWTALFYMGNTWLIVMTDTITYFLYILIES